MGSQRRPDLWLQGSQALPEEDTLMGSLENTRLAAQDILGCGVILPALVVELVGKAIPAVGMVTPVMDMVTPEGDTVNPEEGMVNPEVGKVIPELEGSQDSRAAARQGIPSDYSDP